MDVFLVILTIVLALILLGVNVYFLVYYLDPAEKGFADSWFCKAVAVTGLMLAWAQVLALPLDVSNSRGSGGGLDISVLWQIIYMAVFLFVALILPATMFFYESDESESLRQRICYTVKHMLCLLVLVPLLLGILYGFVAYTKLPVTSYKCSFVTVGDSECEVSDKELELAVTFPIYVMGLLAFVGWFLVVIFGGIGLSAVPLDLINAYRFRPQRKSKAELDNSQRRLREKAAELLELGSKTRLLQSQLEIENNWFAKRRLKNSIRISMNQLQAEVITLKGEFDIYSQECNIANVKPWKYPLYLFLGIIFGLVSLLWLLHILLYLLITVDGLPASDFFNDVLIELEGPATSFIGTSVYCGLTAYLLLAVFKGNIKFGLRFFFCFRAHPIRKDATPMNSILFNLMLLLLASVAVTLFCTNAFSMYTRLSEINNMFGIQVRYLLFFQWFFDNDVFEIALVAWALLAAIYLAVKSRGEATEPKSRIDVKLEKEKMQMNQA